MRGLWIVLALGAGCDRGDPSCKDAVTKASRFAPMKVAEVAAECELESWSGEVRRCLANAAAREAVAGCMKLVPFVVKNDFPTNRSAMEKVKKIEAQIQLRKIGKAATVAYVENAKFPTEAAPLTPEVECCTQNFEAHHKCGPTPSSWLTPAWQALDFEMSTPHFFRYSYTPSADGTSFIATAVGDLDCDNVQITYTLRGSVRDGAPYTEIIEPPPNSD